MESAVSAFDKYLLPLKDQPLRAVVVDDSNAEAWLRANMLEHPEALLTSINAERPHLAMGIPDWNVIDVACLRGNTASNMLEDAVWAFPRVKVGGLLAFGYDTASAKTGVDAFLACYAMKLDVLEHGYQVWVRKTAE